MPGMGAPTETVHEFMAAFKAVWPTADATVLSRFFSEDATYRNGPLEAVRGRSAVVGSLTRMMTIGGEVDVDIVSMVADGPIVMTERIDYWRSDESAASLRVAGVFEVRNGVITAWRDYFDGDEFTSQLPGVS
jgi:limonene-1,2-epoxide hydrolase